MESQCHPKTNYPKGAGKTQRAILDYLATAPAGLHDLRLTRNGTPRSHGLPFGVTCHNIASGVYTIDDPLPAQVRIVQRNARRLQDLDLVDCWHGYHHSVDREYTDLMGVRRVMQQPVSALFVALRWDCDHLDRKREEDRMWREEGRVADLEEYGIYGTYGSGLDALAAADRLVT